MKEITEGFAEETTQNRLALQIWRIVVDKGHPEHTKEVKRLERMLKRKLKSVGGIDKFNEYIDAKNEEANAERGRMRPLDEWP